MIGIEVDMQTVYFKDMEPKNSQVLSKEVSDPINLGHAHLVIGKSFKENSYKRESGLVEMQKYFMKHPFYEKARRANESKEFKP